MLLFLILVSVGALFPVVTSGGYISFQGFDQLLRNVTQLQVDNSKLRADVLKLQQTVATLRHGVSFNAFVETRFVSHNGQRIPFNRIVTNQGGGYNASGIFTVPSGQGGTYVFSWTVATQHSTIFTELVLMSGGDRRTYGGILTHAGNLFNMVTGVVVLILNAGDQVSIEIPVAREERMLESYADQQT